jgi:TPP-dependent 2-oxoacid decarboxylase
MATAMTIGRYLIQQLYNHGVKDIFGIPGDYSLAFIEEMLRSPVQFRNTADEQGAGFAADGYARMGGLGAACVTYAVGSLKVANAAAQAYAERSPVVFITGAPGVQERTRHPLLHHLVNKFETQVEIFRHLTCATAVLNDPETAYAEIDRVIHATLREKRPVYIELPRDMVPVPGMHGHQHPEVDDASDPDVLAEALEEAAAMLTAARQPVIIAGVELKRFGLHGTLARLAEALQIPVAVTMQGKSVVCDDFPLYLGLYAGAIGPEETAQYVEASDCQVLLGTILTDINLGMFTANLTRSRMIVANSDGVSIRHHQYDVHMGHFLDGLLAAQIPAKGGGVQPHPRTPAPFAPQADQPISVTRLFQALNAFIDDEMVVVADIGDSLFGALELYTRREGRFLCSPYYSNMGFAVPGAVGVQMYDRRLRPLVLVGDGAFQMTGMELSTAALYGLSPIVVVLNNGGYATERFFLDGPFNNIQPWDFSRIPAVLGAGQGFAVETEADLADALAAAKANTAGFSILDVRVPRGDVSPELIKLGARFGKTVRG